jgi:hypothetical protein
MAYIYNSNAGTVLNTVWQAPGPMADIYLKSGTGWHGPFDTENDVNAYYEANKAKNPGWKAPTSWTGALSNLPDAASSAAEAATKGIGLSDDELRSWLIRIGEILLGIVLVGVGIAKLTGSTNAIAGLVKAKIP